MAECLGGSWWRGGRKKKREREGEPVVSEGMFRAHGGLFILKAVKIHLRQRGGQRNLQEDAAK